MNIINITGNNRFFYSYKCNIINDIIRLKVPDVFQFEFSVILNIGLKERFFMPNYIILIIEDKFYNEWETKMELVNVGRYSKNFYRYFMYLPA